ncbi:flagellar hook-basal body complex protein FliE [Salinarimonas rosea]|uniref:flagellar hook-basal body complex protein FliE n=1 Tax=Salinarimonas rosea TaxID=552063 RepID=UPI000428E9EC|nr:flagellar hook-basal body complex protein FliE [Salinarimonas rosea]
MIDAVGSLSSLSGLSGVSGLGAARATERLAITAPPAHAGSAAAAGTPDFGAVLADVAKQGVAVVREAEAASIAGMNGKASVQQVVEAVMNAERTLQTAIAVRDKVVQAYQEISRMQI